MALATTSDPAPSFARPEFHDLFTIAEWQDKIAWEAFQDGVEIHRLYGDGIAGPTAALIRFRRDGRVALHRHPGYEHILVLAGRQRDQNTAAGPGTLMINPPGSAHSVLGQAGCIVLAIYEQPVKFLPAAPDVP